MTCTKTYKTDLHDNLKSISATDNWKLFIPTDDHKFQTKFYERFYYDPIVQ